MIQALFTMAAAVSIWQSHQGSIASDRGNPSWTNALSFVCLGFMSASMGLQGIMGKRVNSQFATTSSFLQNTISLLQLTFFFFSAVVLTTVWCEFMADPKLFQLRKHVISRDHKFIAVVALFIGGFVGRAILGKYNPLPPFLSCLGN
jgi:Protein of unknown function (DUF1275)